MAGGVGAHVRTHGTGPDGAESGGVRVRLSTDQALALGAVAAADTAWRAARATLEADIRAEVARQLSALEVKRAEAVRRAVVAGVPKRRIGAEGLHTSDPHAVYAVVGSLPAAPVASGVVLASAEECAALEVQPGEVLTRTPHGLVIWSEGYGGGYGWHAVDARGGLDAGAEERLRGDAVALEALAQLVP